MMRLLIAGLVAISVYSTNFLDEIHINPAHQAVGGTVWVDGDQLTVSSNETHVTAEVFCTNALILHWPVETGKCYDVDWTCDFRNWTNARCWRVGGTNSVAVFLTPMNLPMCFYRLRIVDCNLLTNQVPIPPPPPPPPPPKMRGRI